MRSILSEVNLADKNGNLTGEEDKCFHLDGSKSVRRPSVFSLSRHRPGCSPLKNSQCQLLAAVQDRAFKMMAK